jgi:hypothetical protein
VRRAQIVGVRGDQHDFCREQVEQVEGYAFLMPSILPGHCLTTPF